MTPNPTTQSQPYPQQINLTHPHSLPHPHVPSLSYPPHNISTPSTPTTSPQPYSQSLDPPIPTNNLTNLTGLPHPSRQTTLSNPSHNSTPPTLSALLQTLNPTQPDDSTPPTPHSLPFPSLPFPSHPTTTLSHPPQKFLKHTNPTILPPQPPPMPNHSSPATHPNPPTHLHHRTHQSIPSICTTTLTHQLFT